MGIEAGAKLDCPDVMRFNSLRSIFHPMVLLVPSSLIEGRNSCFFCAIREIAGRWILVCDFG
jgi:hypothetical protein